MRLYQQNTHLGPLVLVLMLLLLSLRYWLYKQASVTSLLVRKSLIKQDPNSYIYAIKLHLWHQKRHLGWKRFSKWVEFWWHTHVINFKLKSKLFLRVYLRHHRHNKKNETFYTYWQPIDRLSMRCISTHKTLHKKSLWLPHSKELRDRTGSQPASTS